MTVRDFLRIQYALFKRVLSREEATALSSKQKDVVDAFHKLYFDAALTGGTWLNTYWCGVQILKCPLDPWIYQEIICEVRPRYIVETGTCNGGSALFMAGVCDQIDCGEILTVDVRYESSWPQHKRIRYLTGSSVAPKIVEEVFRTCQGHRVLVILDSDHSKQHVAKELEAYNEIVPKGSYLIVEDTNINGHPVAPEFGPGPMEAVEEFLIRNKNFQVDKSKEKFLMTQNPNGYLKRIN